MCNTNTSKKASSKPTARSLRWLAKTGHLTGIIEMRITYERKSEFFRYFIKPMEHDYGEFAFEVEKIEPDGSCIEGEIYHVHMAGSRSTCTCPGNTYHGHCKHVDAAYAILERETTKPTVTAKPAIPHDWQRCEAPIV